MRIVEVASFDIVLTLVPGKVSAIEALLYDSSIDFESLPAQIWSTEENIVINYTRIEIYGVRAKRITDLFVKAGYVFTEASRVKSLYHATVRDVNDDPIASIMIDESDSSTVIDVR